MRQQIRKKYFSTAIKADGTVVRGIPAAADWVEENFDERVMAATKKAFFQHIKNWMW